MNHKQKQKQKHIFSIDQSLFVGDRAGLKKQRKEKREVMRMASRPDSQILLVTRQRQNREGEEVGASSSSSVSAFANKDEHFSEKVKSELLCSEEEDDPDVEEAIVRSLTDAGELTQ